MKPNVYDRPMFSKKSGAGVDVDNIGIMQGFKEMSSDVDPEDIQDPQSEQDTEDMHMADRRPDAPEILMNNLRGNMQSVDARYEELAKLVGKSVARDTPEEILALLQPVLAEAQKGIGGLPGAQGMPGMPPPPSGMPPPPPPGQGAGMPPPPPGGAPAPPPMAQGQGAPGSFPPAPDAGQVPGQGPAPVNMAQGGMAADVRRVQEAGRSGDDQLALLSPAARQMLLEAGGSGTINPQTGLREYAWYDLGARLGSGLAERAGSLFRKPEVFNGATATAGETARAGQRIINGLSPNTPGGALYPLRQGAGVVGNAAAGAGRLALENKGKVGATLLGTGVGVSYLRPDEKATSEGNGPRTAAPVTAAETPQMSPPVPIDTSTAGATQDRDDAAAGPAGIAAANAAANPAAPVRPGQPPKQQPGEDTNDYIRRIQNRQAILKQVMDSPEDKDARQAQALFLLSDALGKMTYTVGRTPLQGITKSFSGVAPGLAQMGAQETARQQRIRGTAAEQIFAEASEQRKYDQQISVANIKGVYDLIKANKPENDVIEFLMANGLDKVQASNLAKGIRANVVTIDKDPNGQPRITNPFGGQVTARNDPNPNEIGYIRPGALNVIPTRAMAPATPMEQPRLYEQKRELQSYSNQLDDLVGGEFFKVFGPSANMQRVVGTNMLLPLFGPDAPFAKLDEQGKRNAIEVFKKQFQRVESAGGGRIAVAEQRELSALLENPNAFLGSPELAFDMINRIRIQTANKISEINNSLDPTNYPPVRINPNANFGISPTTALNIQDPNSLRMMDEYSRIAPGFQPYIIAGDGRKPERVKDLRKCMYQEDIQKALKGGQ